jgi:hypothetical protein
MTRSEYHDHPPKPYIPTCGVCDSALYRTEEESYSVAMVSMVRILFKPIEHPICERLEALEERVRTLEP